MIEIKNENRYPPEYSSTKRSSWVFFGCLWNNHLIIYHATNKIGFQHNDKIKNKKIINNGHGATPATKGKLNTKMAQQ